MKNGPKHITVAAGQIAARSLDQAGATLAAIDAALSQARAQGADLLVLPECAYPAYLLGSIGAYRAGGHLPGEAFVRWLCERAERCRMHIVSGFVDDRGENLYNAAVLIDDRGREIGRVHKRFLWGVEHDWFAPGGRIAAFNSRLGRIGVVICAETRAPEILATLAAGGAELVAMPTCWINQSRAPGEFVNPQVEFLIEARAREFGLPFVCADKSGQEQAGVGYVGMSRIVRADGSPAVEAPPTGEVVISARIEPAASAWRCDRREAAARVLGDRPPVRPAQSDLRPIHVAALPGNAGSHTLAADGPFRHQVREHSLDLLIARPAGGQDGDRLRKRAAELGARLLEPPRDCEIIVFAGARVGCLTRAAASFVTPRAMVLDGAAMLVFWHDSDDLPTLRARALENRVFVVGVGERSAAIVGPDGRVLSCAPIEGEVPPIVCVDLPRAADKLVAERTDLLRERRPGSYGF